MVKTYLSMLLAIVAFALNVNAQVTSKPSPLQVDSKDVTIFFHADQGSKGLMGSRQVPKSMPTPECCLKATDQAIGNMLRHGATILKSMSLSM